MLARHRSRLGPHLAAAVPGLIAVGLFILWGEHNGGYDNDTWYWGALLCVALVTVGVLGAHRRPRITRSARLSLIFLSAYVAWSYLSMTWAAAPGIALEGSNRALLYLLIYALMLLLPWRRGGALAALTLWAVGIGVLAVALVVRLAAHDDVGALLVGGRLAAPTGYFNSTAALFTMGLLVSVGLATQRRIPGLLRGLLLALGCADLQLAVIVQSRGWLFTLPAVAILCVAVVRDRLRTVAFAVPPLAGAAVIAHRLLAVYQSSGSSLDPSAAAAGRAGLIVCFVVLVVGTLVAWGDWLLRNRALPAAARRLVGAVVVVLALAGGVGGFVVATHNHPVRFVVRQWNGFSREQHGPGSGSHFADVGSGRYDFWRVSLDAFSAHPIGGLGQDNFDDYYIVRGRSGEEPSWTHSLEMRLLAHTGAVGFALFAGFLTASVALAIGGRRRLDRQTQPLVAIALLPLVVWVVHGSIDWFWEMPALSGPALGFLGVAGSLADGELPAARPVAARAGATGQTRLRARSGYAVGGLALIAATVALGFPYLATRLISIASDTAAADPAQALADLRRAAEVDPLNSDPTRTAGEIALQTGRYRLAATRFRETLAREPGDWFAYLGSGLAASALGDRAGARRDFAAAYRINRTQSANRIALERVDTPHPLTYAQALNLFSVVN